MRYVAVKIMNGHGTGLATSNRTWLIMRQPAPMTIMAVR
jgi:hypothetical protein